VACVACVVFLFGIGRNLFKGWGRFLLCNFILLCNWKSKCEIGQSF
jgi:hypothetical protein